MNLRQKNPRLYERVAEDISAKIVGGEYTVGRRLPSERDLAATYGVSRPTVREAMIALELDGLIEIKKGSGVYVTATGPIGGQAGQTDIGPFELLEARRAIEGEACALAASRISGEELELLESLVEEMHKENARDIVMSEDADRRFHLQIAKATQNSGFLATVEMLWDARDRSPQQQFLRDKAHAAGVKPAIDEHRAIISALREGSPDAARKAMHAHLGAVIEALLEATEVQELEKVRATVSARRQRFIGAN